MEIRQLLNFMHVAEKLKCTTRHSWTSSGRQESVAEHTFRLCLFAWLVKNEFSDCDMEKVMKMCLFHDIGEAVEGDIPAFEKTKEHQKEELNAVSSIADLLPWEERKELLELLSEFENHQTKEAKIAHALDKVEALIQHNEAPIESWLPLEYELQLTYGNEQAKAFSYIQKLREVVKEDSLDKIAKEGIRQNKAGFYVSKDKNRLILEQIVELLKQSNWAKKRSKKEIKQAVENSTCYEVFNAEHRMVGFARIITDGTTTFYLMDVIVDEAYRFQGLGKMLMDAIMEDVGNLYGILHTENAQSFYEKYGFKVTSVGENGEATMEKNRLVQGKSQLGT